MPTSSFATDYAYGYGRIGVLQQRLLSLGDVDRLVGAHDLVELKRILTEIPLTAAVASGIEDLEEILPAMEHWLHDEVDSMVDAPKNSVFDILWLREDAPIIAYLLKEERHMVASGSLKPWKTVTAHDVTMLRALIFEGKRGSLPDHMVEFVGHMKRQKDLTPQKIDAEVAQYVANIQVMLATESGSALVKKYVEQLIDLQNIRTMQRLRPEDDPLEHLLAGGSIQPQRFTRDKRKLASVLRGSGFHFSAAEEFESAEESGVAVERSLIRAIAHELAEMRGIPLSLESLFAFAIVILSQLRVLRTIIVGKSAELSSAEIREMLPPFLSTSPFAS